MELKKKDQQTLEGFFLFRDDPKAKEETTKKLTIQSFKAGEDIYTEKEFFHALGIVLEGECTVYNHQTELNHISKGECFGAAALFVTSENYVTTIRAKKASRIAFLTSRDLTELFKAYPEMAIRYIEFLSQRILFLNRRIDSFTAPSADEALLEYLETHQDETGRVVIEGGFARLSRELSVGRATLYRALSKLQEDGLIQKEGNIICMIKEK